MLRMVRLSALCWVAAACALSAGEKEEKTTRVEGTLVVPARLESFEGRVVEIRLYEFDPFLADVAATLIEKLELKNYSHTKGKARRTPFVVGAKGKLNERMRYYVTLFILQGGKRTHIGECAHRKGLCTVLTGGQPRTITMTVRPVR